MHYRLKLAKTMVVITVINAKMAPPVVTPMTAAVSCENEFPLSMMAGEL